MHAANVSPAPVTIEEFIEARLARDEEAAREASDGSHDWLVEEETISLWPDDREPCDGFMTFPRKAHAHHAAIHSPARVLNGELALKRLILREHHPRENSSGVCCLECSTSLSLNIDEVPWPCEYIKNLAAIWAEHPDYRQEWTL